MAYLDGYSGPSTDLAVTLLDLHREDVQYVIFSTDGFCHTGRTTRPLKFVQDLRLEIKQRPKSTVIYEVHYTPKNSIGSRKWYITGDTIFETLREAVGAAAALEQANPWNIYHAVPKVTS